MKIRLGSGRRRGACDRGVDMVHEDVHFRRIRRRVVGDVHHRRVDHGRGRRGRRRPVSQQVDDRPHHERDEQQKQRGDEGVGVERHSRTFLLGSGRDFRRRKCLRLDDRVVEPAVGQFDDLPLVQEVTGHVRVFFPETVDEGGAVSIYHTPPTVVRLDSVVVRVVARFASEHHRRLGGCDSDGEHHHQSQHQGEQNALHVLLLVLHDLVV